MPTNLDCKYSMKMFVFFLQYPLTLRFVKPNGFREASFVDVRPEISSDIENVERTHEVVFLYGKLDPCRHLSLQLI